MIQEQISTSSPKCLDGNSGFGVVAQTSGMAPNVSREVSMLSGYTHQFAAGDSRNPVAFLHVVRRTGGTNRHIISRVADCGNDYSGRTNRIAHHWIIEELDLPCLLCGPAAILSLSNFFRTQWNEKPQELPRDRKLPNPEVSAQKCIMWEQVLGDAGWGGVLAERAENGNPVSLIFESGMNLLPLLAESFALLPPNIRWKLTFSTFFMKSQEPPGANKVQIKCILAGSDEEAFARLTPNTFVLDLRLRPATLPVGKYVEIARTGTISQQILPPPATIPQQLPAAEQQPQSQNQDNLYGITAEEEIIELTPESVIVPIQKAIYRKQKKKSLFKIIGLLSLILLIIAVTGLGIYYYTLIIHDKKMTAKKAEEKMQREHKEKAEQEREEAEEKAAAEKAEQERKEAEEKAVAEKMERERIEAEKKTAAEKAEQERKEIEAKNAAEKAEQERKETEAKKEQKEIIDGLANNWKPQLLPLPPGAEKSTFLDGSVNLWKYRDLISVQYYSFVDLNISFSGSPQYQLIAEQTITESKTEKTFYVFSFVETNKNVSGDITKKPKKDIAKLMLSKEQGLYFEWIQDNIGNAVTGLPLEQFNRLLLSYIEIKLGENAKKFLLFEPVRYKQTDNGVPRLGQPFKLWKEKNYSKSEGTFWLNFQDKAILEIKNGELKSSESNSQKYKISNFSGDLPDNVLAKPLKITFPDWKNEDKKPYRGTLSLVNAAENRDNLQIKIELKIDRNDLEDKMKETQQKMKEAEEAIKKWTNKRGDIEKIISDTDDRFQKTPQEKQNEMKRNEIWKKLQEWQSYRNKFDEKKSVLTKLKTQIDHIDKFEKEPFLPIPFSLYLQRDNKPEEKLLLFEVQPADTEK
ncbi:MAG: hypothetical protein LBG58_12625 [Planctomycetaceae bacterium]|jgi:hypothetical protein|nr:hypothetical protein [Planctomycetaceae bacterium]